MAKACSFIGIVLDDSAKVVWRQVLRWGRIAPGALQAQERGLNMWSRDFS